MRGGGAVGLAILVFLVAVAAPASARPRWKERIDKLADGRSISISVSDLGASLYRWNASQSRTPASVEKLLLAMPLLDSLPLDKRITTTAYSKGPAGSVVTGDLWLVGRGDPTITAGGPYSKAFPFDTTRLGDLARKIKAAGVTRIQGRIMGSKGYFQRDWWAPGWKSDFPARYIPRPTALAFDGNVRQGKHTSNPERFAAKALRKRLRAVGIAVPGKFGAGHPPSDLIPVARVRSVPVEALLRYMLRKSNNFFAEVFGKRLGLEEAQMATIASGARTIEGWAGSGVTAHDSSGLSYANKIAPALVTELLGRAEIEPWGGDLLQMLPKGGQGTLEDRLGGVRVRAKTGTLTSVSTLAGWVWLDKNGSWAEFAIMSSGMPKSTAADIEDRILRIVSRRAS